MDDPFGEVGVSDQACGGRPAWVRWRGARRRVTAIEGDWWQAGRRLLRVRVGDGELLLLVQREDGRWSVTPATPDARPPLA